MYYKADLLWKAAGNDRAEILLLSFTRFQHVWLKNSTHYSRLQL